MAKACSLGCDRVDREDSSCAIIESVHLKSRRKRGEPRVRQWAHWSSLLIILQAAHFGAQTSRSTTALALAEGGEHTMREAASTTSGASPPSFDLGQAWAAGQQLDYLVAVVDDTQDYGKKERRHKIDKIILEEEGKRRANKTGQRRLVFDTKMQLRNSLQDIRQNMVLTFSGESKSNPQNHWSIYANKTTLLVIKSANKYYYWIVSSGLSLASSSPRAGPPLDPRLAPTFATSYFRSVIDDH